MTLFRRGIGDYNEVRKRKWFQLFGQQCLSYTFFLNVVTDSKSHQFYSIWQAECSPHSLHLLTRSIMVVNVSSVFKLSKYVSPLLDVHSEHLGEWEREREKETGRMRPQHREHGAWVLPLLLLHNSRVLSHSEPEKEAMQTWAPHPLICPLRAFELKSCGPAFFIFYCWRLSDTSRIFMAKCVLHT